MSQSFLSVACAGLLLAAGAYAASESASAPAGPDAAAPAAAKPKAKTKVMTQSVHVLVTLRDASGRELPRSGVRVEPDHSDDAVDIGPGLTGAKLSLPVDGSEALFVLFPGGRCSVTPNAKAIAGGSLTIVVERGADATRCTVADPAAVAGPPASGAGAGGTRDRPGSRAFEGLSGL